VALVVSARSRHFSPSIIGGAHNARGPDWRVGLRFGLVGLVLSWLPLVAPNHALAVRW
jgi:hypothetical protein